MIPRFLLDEHVWAGLIQLGESIGVDVVSVQSRLAEGTDDATVLAEAAKERRVLLTSNARDFAPLAAEWFLASKEHWGIIIVPGQTDRSLLTRGLRAIIAGETAETLKNSFRFIQDWLDA